VREDQFAIEEHVELTALAGSDGGSLVEPGFQGVGQTGRAWLVASGSAVENFGSHGLSLVRMALRLNSCRLYLSGQSTNTAAATTEVHNPSRSPMADWVTLRVVTILSDMRQISLRSS
jgi:hypothetical protein